ncbi:ADP-ribosylglycohydrolase [Chitinophaga sp. YR627]|uniref:ADP-ribosylglycohydrolase family protein n=1 Tax=Chitinophaga sp. YR627 TaxID=1881041 RepID=UPI0008F258BE|nr:ADP-ribosylglycohydrolase family protein [Chitinophaga sp. YR627]SFO55283.1 ADP-ribosylglycohydrolase [Chitinophaga sp. YR627]
MQTTDDPSILSIGDRFEACIIGGAIGDAWGSSYENYVSPIQPKTFYLHPVKEPVRIWSLTDDTQLTLASCEALAENPHCRPDALSTYFVKYYHQQRLSGIGASTLKAIRELEAGGHWSQVGRSGDYAAGNGAAMRIAPFAFFENYTRDDIREISRITHRNDEAYAGALAVVLAIRAILNGSWTGTQNLLDIIIQQLPDTNVRDRMIQIDQYSGNLTIQDIARLGVNGYVVNSVPFAIFAASHSMEIGINSMFTAIINAGGDTDTNAAIAGQIAGALVGLNGIPSVLRKQLQALPEYEWMRGIINSTRLQLRNRTL